MFVHAIKKIEKAMFPIFRVDQTSPTQANFSVAGTGFFVSSNGHFISVAHVFDNTTPQTKYLFVGLLPNNLQSPPLEITEVQRDNANDIFVGRITKKTPDFLSLSDKTQSIGRTVCIGGYPLATLTNNAQGGIDVTGVRRYFQPSFILDHIKAPANNGRGVIRTHEGFLVRDFGLFGMSGGPVFDVHGIILGMQGSVTSPRVSTNGQRSITVENAVVVRSGLILDFLKQNKIRIN